MVFPQQNFRAQIDHLRYTMLHNTPINPLVISFNSGEKNTAFWQIDTKQLSDKTIIRISIFPISTTNSPFL